MNEEVEANVDSENMAARKLKDKYKLYFSDIKKDERGNSLFMNKDILVATWNPSYAVLRVNKDAPIPK